MNVRIYLHLIIFNNIYNRLDIYREISIIWKNLYHRKKYLSDFSYEIVSIIYLRNLVFNMILFQSKSMCTCIKIAIINFIVHILKFPGIGYRIKYCF